jgi:hypothetical protein
MKPEEMKQRQETHKRELDALLAKDAAREAAEEDRLRQELRQADIALAEVSRAFNAAEVVRGKAWKALHDFKEAIQERGEREQQRILTGRIA